MQTATSSASCGATRKITDRYVAPVTTRAAPAVTDPKSHRAPLPTAGRSIPDIHGAGREYNATLANESALCYKAGGRGAETRILFEDFDQQPVELTYSVGGPKSAARELIITG